MTEPQVPNQATDKQDMSALVSFTNAIYVMQALGFFIGLTWLIALGMAWMRRREASGTWLASHYKWQIRSIGFGLLWYILGISTIWLFGLGILIIAINTCWFVYRVARGWLRLSKNMSAYDL